MTSPTAAGHARPYRLLHASAMAGLFCVGLYAASFGPVLEFLADDMDVSLDTAGLILTTFFIGSIAASATVAVALHGRDTRLLGAAGVAAAAAGSTLIAVAPAWPAALAGGAVLGAGDGLIVAALHILMAATSDDVPSAINRLNLWFAIGAVAGPLWAGAVLAATGDRAIVYGGIGACLLATLAAMLAAPSHGTREAVAAPAEFRLPGTPTAWVMGAVLFLYVGAEFGLGSWVSAYVRESADAGVFTGAALSAGYWAALLCGRVLSGAYFARKREASVLLTVSVAGAGAASLLLALSTGNLALSAVAAFGAGLALGPVWPSTVAIASEGSAADATATTVTLGNAGGVLIPWLQGLVLVDAGPAQGVMVTAALCAVMLAIVTAYRLRRR